MYIKQFLVLMETMITMSKLILRLVQMNELRITSDILYSEQSFLGYCDDEEYGYLDDFEYSMRVIETILRVDL